jgi:hypothetical protein
MYIQNITKRKKYNKFWVIQKLKFGGISLEID